MDSSPSIGGSPSGPGDLEMAEDYAYACQRAELLGLPLPSQEEWTKSRQATEPTKEEIEDSIVEDATMKDESLQRVGGGLDELNSILSATQKKLNRFKTVCGSLGAMLKVRVGSRSSTPDHAPLQPNPDSSKGLSDTLTADETISVECTVDETVEKIEAGARRHDINDKIESHVDKLDLLISKAENAQYSMQHQTKQMKKFLK
ncbi:uncharacterized protein LOC124300571 [Neodiprion virginianus]|uniref:uncharacterized protein LOC124178029 n=1 Tax=Neodiprion fabricii TaxID=2872261 RepID=UPI001ED96127|nr:uncharacterized protein LOC124178029 [Neodiprion fabricii]XP_046610760.1 uncharacterized protein LOC124300571 [Neodiprion virginianus]